MPGQRSFAVLECIGLAVSWRLCRERPCFHMQEEWRHADEVCTQILAAPGPVTDWSRLLEPFPFFTTFKNYLQVPRLHCLQKLPGRCIVTFPKRVHLESSGRSNWLFKLVV